MTIIKNLNPNPDYAAANIDPDFMAKGRVIWENSRDLVEVMNRHNPEREAQGMCECHAGQDVLGMTALVGTLGGLIESHPRELQPHMLIDGIALLIARVAPGSGAGTAVALAVIQKLPELMEDKDQRGGMGRVKVVNMNDLTTDDALANLLRGHKPGPNDIN